MTTPTTVNIRLQLRADTAANWAAANPTLLANEVGLETDTKKLKVGNGSTAWNSLTYFPSIVSGGTVLGNLEIGSTGTLTFEGSTADGFETTLAVTNPTADRTITLPNQSGTVVVSGNASIVNADIAANAEIAVSKLANGTANQVIVTDGTNVSWSDNLTLAGDLTVNGTTTTINTQDLLVEDKNIIIGNVTSPTDVTADGGGITLKGATDKTINWVDATDAWTSSERFSIPLGSAASPSLTFTGDENTGIYSPGADQVAISTNGTGRLFVDSGGRLLVNTSSSITAVTFPARVQSNGFYGYSSSLFSADALGSNFFFLKSRNATTGSHTVVQSSDILGQINFAGSDGTNFASGAVIQSTVDGAPASGSVPGNLIIATTATAGTSPSERLRITSAGLVGIGTSVPTTKLTVEGTTLIRDTERLAFNTYTGDTAHAGYIGRNTSTGALEIASQNIGANYPINLITANTSRIHVTATGNVGIGTTSPGSILHCNSATGVDTYIRTTNSNAAGGFDVGLSSGGDAYVFNRNNKPLIFGTNSAENARIDSSGRLLIGTSSTIAGDLLHVSGDTSSSSNSGGIFLKSGLGITSILADYRLGALKFGGGDFAIGAQIIAEAESAWTTAGSGDYPSRLVFSTTADGASSPTERMRISNNGTTSIGYTANTDYRLGVRGGSADNVVIGSDSTRAQGSGWYNFYGTSDSAAVLQSFIRGDGAYGSRTSTYGGLSDARLKENVVDAQSQWGDVKSIRFRNFNLIGDSTRQLGVIAQEIEQISPGLVDEINDRDEQGNETGTSTKLVKYSILYMKAVKALQEAMERIETLEAKVAALESA